MQQLAAQPDIDRMQNQMNLFAALRFACHLLRRKPRGELWLFFCCQIFAVAVVCGILLFSNRIEQAIYHENARLIAADLIVESSRDLHTLAYRSWMERAAELDLNTARSVRLMTMLYFADTLQLTELRAVSEGYPLRGKLTAASASDPLPVEQMTIPLPGEIWLDTKTAKALGVQPGDTVEAGNRQLYFAKVLHDEPGLVLPSVGFSGRALMNWRDLSATDLLQSGSRASYRLMFAGEGGAMQIMQQWLSDRLTVHEELIASQQPNDNSAEFIDRAGNFLNLGGAGSLLLAVVATLITAQKYLQHEQNTIAIWRATGINSRLLGSAYLLMVLVWWVVATVLGCLLGYFLQAAGFYAIDDWLQITSSYSLQPFFIAALTALFCLLCFILPVLTGMAKISPMRLLRSGADDVLQSRLLWWLLPAFLLLLNLYSGDWWSTLSTVAGLLALVLFTWLLTALVARLVEIWLQRQSLQPRLSQSTTMLYLGLRAFSRQPRSSQIRIAALATTLAVYVVILGVRSELLSAWRAQLPDNAPNYFAVNIAAQQQPAFSDTLQKHRIETQGLFPVARARLVAINGKVPDASNIDSEGQETLERELVLTEQIVLPDNNVIVQGSWHGNASDNQVSVEKDVAQELNIQLDDRLTFSFAGDQIVVQVTSLRQVNWNSMQPNFFFILAAPQLQQFPFTYLTSFFVSPQHGDFTFQLGRGFPGVTLIDVGALIEQLEAVIDRVSLAVEALAIITVIAAILVLVASLRASLDERIHEQSILRALGGRASSLRTIAALELAISGAIAGLAASIAGTLIVAALGRWVFQLPMLLPVWLQSSTVLVAIAIACVTGMLILNKVYTVSPVTAWRAN